MIQMQNDTATTITTTTTTTTTTIADFLRTGVRVWFTNCGTEPQWRAKDDDASFDKVRPWTDADTEELLLWQEMEEAALAASSGTAETDW